MTDDRDDEVSDLAMSIMHAVAYDHGRLPVKLGYREMSRLSERECLIIDRAIRKQGLQLDYRADEDELTIRDIDQ